MNNKLKICWKYAENFSYQDAIAIFLKIFEWGKNKEFNNIPWHYLTKNTGGKIKKRKKEGVILLQWKWSFSYNDIMKKLRLFGPES